MSLKYAILLACALAYAVSAPTPSTHSGSAVAGRQAPLIAPEMVIRQKVITTRTVNEPVSRGWGEWG